MNIVDIFFNDSQAEKKYWFIRNKVEILIRLMDSRLRPAGMTNKKPLEIVILGLDPGIHVVSP
jgi:hypothetical protein